MNKIPRLLLLLLTVTAAPFAAAGESTIELTDGSRIVGHVVGVDGDRYLIQSPILGRVPIDAERIRAIYPNGSPTGHGEHAASAYGGMSPDHTRQLLQLQQQLTANPQVMTMIQALRNDPQLTALLSDPSVMQAIAAGDLGSLRANPNFRALLERPDIRAIVEQAR